MRPKHIQSLLNPTIFVSCIIMKYVVNLVLFLPFNHTTRERYTTESLYFHASSAMTFCCRLERDMMPEHKHSSHQPAKKKLLSYEQNSSLLNAHIQNSSVEFLFLHPYIFSYILVTVQ